MRALESGSRGYLLRLPSEWRGICAGLGFALGIAMPVISALLFPTYMHQMPDPAVEVTRLIELPFVVFEMAVVFLAYHRGMDRAAMWRGLPRDIRIAIVALLSATFASSIFLSAQPVFSLIWSVITVIHLLFALSVYYLFAQAPAVRPIAFLPLLGAGLGVLALYTWWRFAFPPPPSEVLGGVIEWGSALPGFISVRHFGAWTGAVAAGFAVRILYTKPSATPGWNHAFYALAAGLTVWSGTRAAILAIIVACMAVAMIQRRMPGAREMGHAAILTGIAMCFAWMLLPPDPTFYLIAPEDLAGDGGISSGRVELWAATWARWLESPILGWGSGATFWEVDIGWSHTQPHNLVLQFLITWGAVGAVAALWLLGRGVVEVHRAVAGQPQLLALLAVLDALLVQSLFEGMLHYPRFVAAIIVLMALLLTAARDTADEARTPD